MTAHFEDKSVGFVWNNLSKIGRDKKGKQTKKIASMEKDFFNVFLDEFDILKPDIVIFTTGSRDHLIRRYFGPDCKFLPKMSVGGGKPTKETLNLIAEIDLPGRPNVSAIRVEHPSRRTLKNSIIFDVLIDCIERNKVLC